jgi:hypothetical protein
MYCMHIMLYSKSCCFIHISDRGMHRWAESQGIYVCGLYVAGRGDMTDDC